MVWSMKQSEKNIIVNSIDDKGFILLVQRILTFEHFKQL